MGAISHKMLEIDFVFSLIAVRLIFHSIRRGAQNSVRCSFGDQLMRSRDQLNGHKILLVHAFILPQIRGDTGRKKWEFNKIIWIILGIVVLVLIVVDIQQFGEKPDANSWRGVNRCAIETSTNDSNDRNSKIYWSTKRYLIRSQLHNRWLKLLHQKQ